MISANLASHGKRKTEIALLVRMAVSIARLQGPGYATREVVVTVTATLKHCVSPAAMLTARNAILLRADQAHQMMSVVSVVMPVMAAQRRVLARIVARHACVATVQELARFVSMAIRSTMPPTGRGKAGARLVEIAASGVTSRVQDCVTRACQA